jgi:Protein of unknown function (DUF1566)
MAPEEPLPPDTQSESEEPREEGDESSPPGLPGLQLPKRLELLTPDSQQPMVTLRFSTDADCVVSVGGVDLATLVAGERKDLDVLGGERRIRARSVKQPLAVWEKVMTVREGSEREVQIKMVKSLHDFERQQRQTDTYRDTKHLLMWTRRDNGTDVRFKQAVEYCANLRLAGYEDWRVPTLEELESIRSLWSGGTFKVAGPISLSACCPWSADRQGEEEAWNYNFRHRRPFLGHSPPQTRTPPRRPLLRPRLTPGPLKGVPRSRQPLRGRVPDDFPKGEGFPASAPSH